MLNDRVVLLFYTKNTIYGHLPNPNPQGRFIPGGLKIESLDLPAYEIPGRVAFPEASVLLKGIAPERVSFI